MKKKFLPLIVCVVLLAGLTAAYFLIQNRNSQSEEQPTVQSKETIYLVSRNRTEIESIILKNKDMNFTFIPTDEKRENWTVKDKDNIYILSSPINSLSYSFGEFAAYSKVEAENINPADFGFSNPTAVATAAYTDGTSETLIIGSMTPDKEYAYIMREGDDSVYMIYEYTAQRFTKTLNDIVDKTLPVINTNDISFFYVNQKGKRPIEIAFDGTEEEMVEQYEAYGGIGLLMFQPYYRRDIYVSNLELYVTTNLASIALSELVEAEPADYGKYGLIEPELELMISNVYGDVLHLLLGNETEDGFIYCQIGGRYEVFKIAKSQVKSYYDIDLFKFIARFAALINIITVEQVTIKSEQANHVLNTNHGIIKATEEGGTDIEIITPVVDGVLVDETAFRKAYESIVAISFDTTIEPVKVSGEPAVTITYKFNTGEPNAVIKLYEYNNDFYMMANDEGIAEFAINKFGVKTMFERIGNLIKK